MFQGMGIDSACLTGCTSFKYLVSCLATFGQVTEDVWLMGCQVTINYPPLQVVSCGNNGDLSIWSQAIFVGGTINGGLSIRWRRCYERVWRTCYRGRAGSLLWSTGIGAVSNLAVQVFERHIGSQFHAIPHSQVLHVKRFDFLPSSAFLYALIDTPSSTENGLKLSEVVGRHSKTLPLESWNQRFLKPSKP